MYRWGHVGAALFCYGPVGAALSRAGDPELALAGTVVAVALATVPDIDEFLAIDHRGLTHTVWFVGGGAVLSAAVGVGVGLAIDRPIAVATAVGTAAAVSLVSHLLADSITPMGIRPFFPVSAWHHTFGITPAANQRANGAMLCAGFAFTIACQALVLAPF